MAQYPALIEDSSLYVYLGNTSVNLFDKSTFMNLADLAESKQATALVLVLDKLHTDRKQYERMFKVIDATKVKSEHLPSVRNDAQQQVNFYQLQL